MNYDYLLDATIKLLISAILAGAIGLERDLHGRSAGMRTHILIGIGATLYILTSMHLSKIYGQPTDPNRVLGQVVTGIGFLGAGVIIKTGLNIKGLTTAGCVWVAAAVGCAVGLGAYGIAVVTTVIALIVLVFLVLLGNFYKSMAMWNFIIKVPGNIACADKLCDFFHGKKNIKILYLEQISDIENNIREYIFTTKVLYKGPFHDISDAIFSEIKGVIPEIKYIDFQRSKII